MNEQSFCALKAFPGPITFTPSPKMSTNGPELIFAHLISELNIAASIIECYTLCTEDRLTESKKDRDREINQNKDTRTDRNIHRQIDRWIDTDGQSSSKSSSSTSSM